MFSLVELELCTQTARYVFRGDTGSKHWTGTAACRIQCFCCSFEVPRMTREGSLPVCAETCSYKLHVFLLGLIRTATPPYVRCILRSCALPRHTMIYDVMSTFERSFVSSRSGESGSSDVNCCSYYWDDAVALSKLRTMYLATPPAPQERLPRPGSGFKVLCSDWLKWFDSRSGFISPKGVLWCCWSLCCFKPVGEDPYEPSNFNGPTQWQNTNSKPKLPKHCIGRQGRKKWHGKEADNGW